MTNSNNTVSAATNHSDEPRYSLEQIRRLHALIEECVKLEEACEQAGVPRQLIDHVIDENVIDLWMMPEPLRTEARSLIARRCWGVEALLPPERLGPLIGEPEWCDGIDKAITEQQRLVKQLCAVGAIPQDATDLIVDKYSPELSEIPEPIRTRARRLIVSHFARASALEQAGVKLNREISLYVPYDIDQPLGFEVCDLANNLLPILRRYIPSLTGLWVVHAWKCEAHVLFHLPAGANEDALIAWLKGEFAASAAEGNLLSALNDGSTTGYFPSPRKPDHSAFYSEIDPTQLEKKIDFTASALIWWVGIAGDEMPLYALGCAGDLSLESDPPSDLLPPGQGLSGLELVFRQPRNY